jgi:starvation-inducible DNA-binding protein
MSCQTKLANLIADNFLAYFNAHVYHFNVVGPDFVQYHDLFSEVYEYLFENHDTLSEQLRQMKVKVPGNIKGYLEDSVVNSSAMAVSIKDMLTNTCDDLDAILKSSQKLYEEAGVEGHGALETYIGDYMTGVSKLKWKVDACLS